VNHLYKFIVQLYSDSLTIFDEYGILKLSWKSKVCYSFTTVADFTLTVCMFYVDNACTMLTRVLRLNKVLQLVSHSQGLSFNLSQIGSSSNSHVSQFWLDVIPKVRFHQLWLRFSVQSA